MFVLFALLSAGAHAQWLKLSYSRSSADARWEAQPLGAGTAHGRGKPDLSGVWMNETTTVADMKRLFGNCLDGEIALAPPRYRCRPHHILA